MSAPLADRLRPSTLELVVGQKHLIGDNKPLSNIIKSGKISLVVSNNPDAFALERARKAGIKTAVCNKKAILQQFCNEFGLNSAYRYITVHE